ncbi:MAG: flippase-like domain-containing protein, partial [Methanobacterium sp.]|nr:flippase-like domain-containing protein [Methanobacterium sp.]
FSKGFLQVVKDKRIFIIGFILSFFMWGLDIVRFYVCFVTIGVYPPVIPLIIIYTLGILIMLVPLLPGSWGIREVLIVGLFAVVGVAGDVVLSASLIDRFVSYILPTIIGAFAALYYGNRIKQSRKSKSSYP